MAPPTHSTFIRLINAGCPCRATSANFPGRAVEKNSDHTPSFEHVCKIHLSLEFVPVVPGRSAKAPHRCVPPDNFLTGGYLVRAQQRFLLWTQGYARRCRTVRRSSSCQISPEALQKPTHRGRSRKFERPHNGVVMPSGLRSVV